MRDAIKSYEDLDVWRLGIELTIRAYSMAAALPPSEKYELSSQMRRCVVSIPANIAEGHARRLPKPYLNHVNIALGSLAEWVTYLVIAERLGFVSRADFDQERNQADRLGQMLHALAGALERRIERLRLRVAFAALLIGGSATALAGIFH